MFAASVAGAQEQQRTIEVKLPYGKLKAVDAVQAALLKEGFMVASNEGGIITLAPFETRKNKAVSVTIRANILGSDSASSIILGGQWSNAMIEAARREHPALTAAYSATGTIETGGKGFMKDAWDELERVADAIRKSAQ